MNTVTEALGEHLPDRDVWKSFVSGLLGPHGWTTTRVTDGPKIVGTAKWYVSPFAAVAVFRMGDWLNGSAIELPFSKTGTASTIRHAGGVGVVYDGTNDGATPTTWPVSAGVSTTAIPSGSAGDLVVLTLFFAESFGAEAK